MRSGRGQRRAAIASSAIVVGGLLGPAAIAQGSASAAPPSDLIISEYVEGSSNNKALELWNGTGSDVDLGTGGYSVKVYFNGSTSAGSTVALTGTIPSGGTHVLADDGASFAAGVDQTTTASLWNGDDAVVLSLDDGTVVDSLGQVGDDPGTQWGTGDASTADNTLRRTTCTPDTDTGDAFDPADGWQGFPQDTFDGLGSHNPNCDGTSPGSGPVINEFSASTTGTDVEYLEVYGDGDTDYSDLTILQVEGDASSSARGTVVGSYPVGTTDADGLWLGDLAANSLQNGTLTLMLVDGWSGAAGEVLDSDQDGTIDATPWTDVVDDVAVDTGEAGTLTYSSSVLGPNYDGPSSFAPGGASRIPDGTDTDTASDWVRNDFDLAGIEGHGTTTLDDGEALNTPGAPNTTEAPTPPGGVCGDAASTIGSIQGNGAATDVPPDEVVQVEGTVIGDFQTGGFNGYYLQDQGDGDAATSDGIFVYAPGGVDVAEGDSVHVTGTVSEFSGMTEITASAADVCSSGNALPTATEVTLPLDGPDALEPLEGMRVTLPQSLDILEYFNFDRFGEVVVGTDRQYQPTAVHEPGSPEAKALAEQNALSRITIDDGRSVQNPDPAIHPDGDEFTLDNRFRGGDLVTNATGVLDYRFDLWRVQPTQGADYEAVNLRPDAPDVSSDFTVASFNVLNYFTTLGSRGAQTPEEFDRQEAKIVAALREMDADVVGLIEIENNQAAIQTLVQALNDEVGAGTYAYVDTGVIGTDEIKTAFIYKPATVDLDGDYALLDSSVDPRFNDDKNRPALAQTFVEKATGGEVTIAVNHLKSKGSSCDDVGDPEDPDGQGNCNGIRTQAAEALVDWLDNDPTGTGAGSTLIVGDLNAYDHEDPIETITDAGYTDLVREYGGEHAYSYVFDGQLGYLDQGLASPELLDQVTGTRVWHSNADEPDLLDYTMEFKEDAQDAIYAPDPYRASDHDAVVIGLDLTPPDTTAPELTVTADPSRIWPPNNKFTTVTTSVDAIDDSGGDVTVRLVGVSSSGRRASATTLSDTEFRVKAVNRASYTITYEATDEAGNTATESVTVDVLNPAHGG